MDNHAQLPISSRERQTARSSVIELSSGHLPVFQPVGDSIPKDGVLFFTEVTVSQSIASRQGESSEQGFCTQFDLFGQMNVRIQMLDPPAVARTRKIFAPRESTSPTLSLFEFLDVPGWKLPSYAQEEDEDEEETDVDISYAPSGKVFIQTHRDLKWSREGIIDLQNHLFHRSIEELGNKNNELDQWSVLRWIFAPAIQYMWRKTSEGKVVTEEVHERDNPFSFHNCAIAARVDAETLREGIRRNLAPDVIIAIERTMSRH
jgi:hypothetical protein